MSEGYEDEQEPQLEDRRCDRCLGGGVLGVVSKEMAMDAGAPEMEGQPISCYQCGGQGWL